MPKFIWRGLDGLLDDLFDQTSFTIRDAESRGDEMLAQAGRDLMMDLISLKHRAESNPAGYQKVSNALDSVGGLMSAVDEVYHPE